MRLEDLYPDTKAEVLEKLSDAELENILRPLFPKSRPELKSSETVVKRPKQQSFEDLEKKRKVEEARKIAASLGIKI